MRFLLYTDYILNSFIKTNMPISAISIVRTINGIIIDNKNEMK